MDFALLIPMVAIAGAFGIPQAAILTSHQRRMAEIMRSDQGNQMSSAVVNELRALRAEIAQLHSRLDEQAIVIDDLRSIGAPQQPPALREDLAQRLQG